MLLVKKKCFSPVGGIAWIWVALGLLGTLCPAGEVRGEAEISTKGFAAGPAEKFRVTVFPFFIAGEQADGPG